MSWLIVADSTPLTESLVNGPNANVIRWSGCDDRSPGIKPQSNCTRNDILLTASTMTALDLSICSNVNTTY